jgi:uncharacterized RDD family membrane protein YckC
MSDPTPIDTLRVFETPEGVDLALHPAGPVARAAALAIDLGLRFGLYLLLLPLLGLAGLGFGLALIAVFLLEWFYPVFFELRRGATPGKRALGLLVTHHDGTPVGPSASLIRNLLRVVDALPLFYGTGLVAMLLDRDFRRLGDLAAGTLVIHAPPPRAPRTLPVRAPQPPPQPLDPEMQQAVLDYAERCSGLSSARRAELAGVLMAGWSGDDHPSPRGDAAVDELLSIANWLARGR